MRRLIVGRKYKHFKGGIYQVLNIATHTESGEEFVIYKSQETEKIWARPIEMFNSEVDKSKYPNIQQRYRFELMEES